MCLTDFWHLSSVNWEGKPWGGTWAYQDDGGVWGSGRSQEWLQGSQGGGGGGQSGAENWAPGGAGGRYWCGRRCFAQVDHVCHTRGKGRYEMISVQNSIVLGLFWSEKSLLQGQARRTSDLGSETLNSPRSIVDVKQNSVWSAVEDKSAPMFVWGYPCGFFNGEKDEPSLNLIGCLGNGRDFLYILWQQVFFLIAKDSHPGNAQGFKSKYSGLWCPQLEPWLCWPVVRLTATDLHCFHRWKPIPPFLLVPSRRIPGIRLASKGINLS